ncbi:DUF1120 domain-containing protein [Pseudoxanthomonas sp. UTMC 1351]|uniref:DUF1120 domain-containing protein n=1 Tax=Pseudoxanthomonas sp. UTMC 1351 TaxID=2695853 RepID=UPI0034CEB49F
MKQIGTLAFLCAGLLSSWPARADNRHAEFSLRLSLTPSACRPSLSGGGTIDYGEIPASQLSRTAQTALSAKAITLSVDCDAATYFALRFIDNRAAGDGSPDFSLGESNDRPVGAYRAKILQPFSEASPLALLRSDDDGALWQEDSAEIASGVLYGFALPGKTLPGAHSRVTTELQVQAQLAPRDKLPEAANLDGSATIEVIYL